MTYHFAAKYYHVCPAPIRTTDLNQHNTREGNFTGSQFCHPCHIPTTARNIPPVLDLGNIKDQVKPLATVAHSDILGVQFRSVHAKYCAI